MIGKILLSLLIGGLVGGVTYVVLGALRKRGSDGNIQGNQKGIGANSKKPKRIRPTDGDENNGSGRAPGSGKAPTKEWFGGFRE
ncbi:MAG: hypothetical protein FPO08_07540 [Geobacter sp.]|nr:MAG: hypothetical protein FPO08_07540 [Geobacter sp.]